jgi:flagellar hook-basal body complex protein FliE
MTSPISPISIPSVGSLGVGRNRALPNPADGATTDTGKSAGQAAGFADAVGQAVSSGLNEVGRLDQAVTEAAQQAAVGNLESVSDLMIATTEAQLATEITVAVRDRAITAFNDIMRMQI